jgi:hypothetical protein
MACSFALEPLARFVAGGAGARPDHPISRSWIFGRIFRFGRPLIAIANCAGAVMLALTV